MLDESSLADPRSYFLRITWFDRDLPRARVLDDLRLDALCAAAQALCAAHAIAESRLRLSAATLPV